MTAPPPDPRVWSGSPEGEGETPGGGSPVELPNDLLAGAVARVQLLCVLLAVVAVVYEALDLGAALGLFDFPVDFPDGQRERRVAAFHVVAAVSVVSSAAMFALGRFWAGTPRRVVEAALIYQVLGALLVSVGERVTPWLPNEGISIACLWIMTFPFVPSSPRRAAAAAYIAASMGPAGYLLGAALRRRELPPIEQVVFLYLPSYLAATFALAGSIVIYRLATDVTRARRLGGYQLVKLLGTGGMGEVWLARHRALVRPAAIKLMRADTLGSTRTEARAIHERFHREVQATADMESPHTIEIYDFGTAADGRLYYAMELLRGLDLEVIVKRFGPLPAERAVHLLRQICHSLAEAHARGLVHRDIKPSNIHACVLGLDCDFVKVLDFGLVKHQEPGNPHVSLDGMIVGTPAYVSPEAANGDPIDARTDLYSLGCVAFWMLAGRTVFGDKTPVLMVADHARTPAEAPSRVSPLPIPPELDALVLACLAKDPKARPASAEALSAELAKVPVASPWTADRAHAWWRDNHPAALDRPELVERAEEG